MVPRRVAPFFVLGKASAPPRESSAAMSHPDSASGRTPASGEYAPPASLPSSMGQYATRSGSEGMRLRSVDSRAFWPWPRRRVTPEATTDTHTSAPDTSHSTGQAEISPVNRYSRSETFAPAGTVQVRPAESAHVVAPSTRGRKSGEATTVPLIPDRTSARWTRPASEEEFTTFGGAMSSGELLL